MEGDFQFGSNSNSLDLLSEVAVVVKNWEEEDVEKAMAMAVRSRCNPLQGFGFDGYVVPDKATIKITNRLKKANTFGGICIPKKKRTSLRRGRTVLTSYALMIPSHYIRYQGRKGPI
ncbi:uncharacterized protein Pyn_16370 [Prunus yedoensis var. nudiflora]|uniref:Uncharacterized protein n=1 Tax=Prunus yedoensis var. nudiflora TaxID=2094558 RepID=A0A314Y8W6_PRUYE|nr:uncharacterized protein Pyn_16370 [Prunus yedoensis var. nudiflora]